MKVELYELKEVPLDKMVFAVNMARYEGKWIFVQRQKSGTWEIPGGRLETGESIFDCAARELMEESGAVKFALFPVAIVAITEEQEPYYGLLFFADVHEMGSLPREFEMKRQMLSLDLPKKLTFPEIQPKLYYRTLEYIMERGL